jgi:hypothetical protein
MLGKPVHDITMIGSDALTVAFRVTDDILFGQTIFFAQIRTKFDGLLVHLTEVRCISEAVFTDLETDMGIVGRAACVPATMIPRQSLIGGNGAISQLADKSVDADFSAAGVVGVPMIVVLVLPQQTIVGANIALQPGLFAPVLCTMMPLTVIFLPAL